MTFTERRQRVTDTDGVLLFLEMSAPSMPEVLRIVNDRQNWTSNGHEYIGFPFQFKASDDVSGQPARAQIVVDNVGRSLTEDLERMAPNETVDIRIMVSDRVNPNVYEQDIMLPQMRVSVNTSTVTVQAGDDFIMRQQAVQLRFTPHLTPGLF